MTTFEYPMTTRQQRRQHERQQAKRNIGAIAETTVKTAVLWAFLPHSWRAAPAAPTPTPASPEPPTEIAINCNRPDVRQIEPLHDAEPDGGADVGGEGLEKTKYCPDCNEQKPASEYDLTPKGNLSKRCKPCTNRANMNRIYGKEPREYDGVRGPKIRTPEKICAGCGTSHEYRQYKKDPAGLFGISDYCVLCAAIIAFDKGELVPDAYPNLRGAGVIENYASFKFGVGGFGGSRAGVSPAQRTLEARSPSKMSHG